MRASAYGDIPKVRGHKDNPVAWQMWGPGALSLAKEHNRLLFVSIGYAACHCTSYIRLTTQHLDSYCEYLSLC